MHDVGCEQPVKRRYDTIQTTCKPKAGTLTSLPVEVPLECCPTHRRTTDQIAIQAWLSHFIVPIDTLDAPGDAFMDPLTRTGRKDDGSGSISVRRDFCSRFDRQ